MNSLVGYSRPMKDIFRIILLCLGIVSCVETGVAQIGVDSAVGLVGKEVQLPLTFRGVVPLNADQEFTVRGEFKMSNPTVFFPQVFRPLGAVTVLENRLERSTDSTWSFTLTLRTTAEVLPGDSLCVLAGEALAGADSVTSLFFHDMFIGEEAIPDITGVILTRSIGSRIPYVRFATLDPGRPNPTAPGITVQWGFRIDKSSEVIFKIYDMLGQEIEVQELGELDQGVYVNTFTPDFTFPSGMFFVRLITNSGEAWQIMHVLR